MKIPNFLSKLFAPLFLPLQRQTMRDSWDSYAKRNAKFYIATEGKPLAEEFQWDSARFFSQGEQEFVNALIEFDLPESGNNQWTVLEIGCGIGRQTHAIAKRYGKVIALDISLDMIIQAKNNLWQWNNIEYIVGNGSDLSSIPSLSVDFVYSFVVFQHITDASITENYIREAARILKTGGHFVFQVRDLNIVSRSHDVWSGSDFSSARVKALAAELSMNVLKAKGQGTQYLWAHLLKR